MSLCYSHKHLEGLGEISESTRVSYSPNFFYNVAGAEIVPGQGRHTHYKKKFYTFVIFSIGHLGKTNVPNVSTLRSIHYSPNNMKVFNASSIGTGIAIPYKQIDFETNMRIVSPFGYSIDKQQSNTVPKE